MTETPKSTPETPKKKHKALKITLLFLLGVAVISAAAFFIYAGIYYHADDVSAFTADGDRVTYEDDGDLSFAPTGATKAGFVFYPGAKVEEKAYAPLCYHLAENGVHAYIVKMPFRLALFGKDKGGAYPSKDESIPWYLGGHSLGGAMAASYLGGANHGYAGLALLASYSTANLVDSGLKTTTIYGSEDQVLNKGKYTDSLPNLPADNVETIIAGGNHSGFAYYGPQKGDGEASLSKDEQIALTVQALLAFMGI
jgi:hypothetical protein